MNLSVGWKFWLACLIGIGALIYLFPKSDGGTYRAPQAVDGREEPAAGFNRAKYAEILKSTEIGRLIMKVEKGLSSHEILLTAGPRWRALGEAVRLRSARVLWDSWAELHPPGQRYKARIVILDENGAKIGGSRLLDPSQIWVRKN